MEKKQVIERERQEALEREGRFCDVIKINNKNKKRKNKR